MTQLYKNVFFLLIELNCIVLNLILPILCLLVLYLAPQEVVHVLVIRPLLRE